MQDAKLFADVDDAGWSSDSVCLLVSVFHANWSPSREKKIKIEKE